MAATPLKPSIDCDSWCTTYFAKDIEHTFVWDIHKFMDRVDESGDCLYSSIFTVTGYNHISKWKLQIYPNGERKIEGGNISLYLEKVSEGNVVVNECNLSIIDQKGKNIHVKSLDKTSFTEEDVSWGFSIFFEKDNLRFYDIQNILTIQCKITIEGCERKVFGSKNPKEQLEKGKVLTDCKKRLREDLHNLLLSKEDSDLEITSKGKVFRCHKVLLQSRSPVFKAMFANAMQESSSHKVKIEDVDAEVLGEMLEYIYTGTAPNAGDISKELLAAADKYQLMELKSLCEVELCDSLQVDNAVGHLILADFYRIPKLKKLSMQIIVKNMAVAVKSQEWKERLTKNDALIREVLEAIAENSINE